MEILCDRVSGVLLDTLKHFEDEDPQSRDLAEFYEGLAGDCEGLCKGFPHLEPKIRAFYRSYEDLISKHVNASKCVSRPPSSNDSQPRQPDSSHGQASARTLPHGSSGMAGLREEPGRKIAYEEENGVVTLLPEPEDNFRDLPALLERAEALGAAEVGVFKYVVPLVPATEGFEDTLDGVSSFNLIHKADGTVGIDRREQTEFIEVRKASELPASRSHQAVDSSPDILPTKQSRYCADIEARTASQRDRVGLPAVSPIWPLEGNQLPRTKVLVPGLHTPYGYVSNASGGLFALHKEDHGLHSLNVLYFGTKHWDCVMPKDATRIENRFGGAFECAQKVRHDPTFVPTVKFVEWDISWVSFTQRAGEVVVVFPQTYHQGWTRASSLAEAINYAPVAWTGQGYRECKQTCPGYPIPNAHMAFLNPGEKQTEANSLVRPASVVEDHMELESQNEVVRRTSIAKRKGEVINTSSKRQRTATSSKQGLSARTPIRRPTEDSSSPEPRPSSHPKTVSSAPHDAAVLAVGSPHAFRALHDVLISLAKKSERPMLDLFSSNPRQLMCVLDHLENSTQLMCYLRRLALVKLYNLYKQQTESAAARAHKRRQSDLKAFKSASVSSFVENMSGLKFPTGEKLTKKGLIANKTPEAARWNRRKSQLLDRVERGKRWHRMTNRFGFTALFLIDDRWRESSGKSVASDTR